MLPTAGSPQPPTMTHVAGLRWDFELHSCRPRSPFFADLAADAPMPRGACCTAVSCHDGGYAHVPLLCCGVRGMHVASAVPHGCAANHPAAAPQDADWVETQATQLELQELDAAAAAGDLRRLSAAIKPHFAHSDLMSALTAAVVRGQPHTAGRMLRHTQEPPFFADGQWGSLDSPDSTMAAAVRFCAAEGGLASWWRAALEFARGRFSQTFAAVLETAPDALLPADALRQLLRLRGLPATAALPVLSRHPILAAELAVLVQLEAQRGQQLAATFLEEVEAGGPVRLPVVDGYVPFQCRNTMNHQIAMDAMRAEALLAQHKAAVTLSRLAAAQRQARTLLLCLQRHGSAQQFGRRCSMRLAGLGAGLREPLPLLPPTAVDCIVNVLLLSGLGVID